jgi:hypothetical protein
LGKEGKADLNNSVVSLPGTGVPMQPLYELKANTEWDIMPKD